MRLSNAEGRCAGASSKPSLGWARSNAEGRCAVPLICALAIVAGCSPSAEPRSQAAVPSPVEATPVEAVAKPPPVTSAPHGMPITLLAVTEQVDAAVTADAGARLRIWPRLDGSQEPVVVIGGEPRQLAIARDGVTLLIAILDTARNLELVRVDRDGHVLGRAHPPGEQSYLEVEALAGGMLALRADRAVEWFDARGASRGVLVPEAGTRVLSLATRRGAALALLESGDEPSKLRWIAVADRLLWSTTVQLPITIDRVALSPDHHRIAGLVRGAANVAIVELAPAVAVIGNVAVTGDGSRPFGFTDDDRAGIIGASALDWWVARPPPTPPPQKPVAVDPWNTSGAQVPVMSTPISDTTTAIGDGVVVAAMETSLALITPTRTRYLGYHELAIGTLAARGATVVLASGGHVLWLDHKLAAVHASSKRDQENGIVAVVDDHHVLATRSDPDRETGIHEVEGTPPPLAEVLVRDTASGKELVVGKFSPYQAYTYDAATRVIAIAGDLRTERYRLDPMFATATKLQPLKTNAGSTVTPCAGANGAVAGATSNDDEGATVFATFVEPTPAKPSTRPLRPINVTLAGGALGIDPRCRLVTSRITNGQLELWRYDQVRPTKVATIPAPKPGPLGSVSFTSDGSAIALVAGAEILVVDLTNGTVRWRISLWQPHTVVFTGDDRQVIVASQGLLALDATTGHRTAAACGWNFALTDEAYNSGTLGTTTVCEEAP